MGLNRRQRMQKAPQDREEWQKLYYLHQKAYQRRRLDAIKLLWDNWKLIDVCFHLNCNIKSLEGWIDSYLSGGFTKLLRAKVSGKLGKGQLSDEQLRLLKYMIVHKTPLDYDYEFYRWTLALIGDLLKKKWNIHLKKSQIQVILTKH
mgnify:CR=1 FL=1